MTETPAALFVRTGDLESFRRAVVARGGDFSFDVAAMNALGLAYFEKHPDRTHDRNLEEVRLGYGLVRVCAVEKAVTAIPESRRTRYREILEDVLRVGPALREMLESATAEELVADHVRLKAALDEMKSTIDELPKGMIKERFIGGISSLFNTLYVLRVRLPKDGS